MVSAAWTRPVAKLPPTRRASAHPLTAVSTMRLAPGAMASSCWRVRVSWLQSMTLAAHGVPGELVVAAGWARPITRHRAATHGNRATATAHLLGDGLRHSHHHLAVDDDTVARRQTFAAAKNALSSCYSGWLLPTTTLANMVPRKLVVSAARAMPIPFFEVVWRLARFRCAALPARHIFGKDQVTTHCIRANPIPGLCGFTTDDLALLANRHVSTNSAAAKGTGTNMLWLRSATLLALWVLHELVVATTGTIPVPRLEAL